MTNHETTLQGLHTFEDQIHITEGRNFLGFIKTLKTVQEMHKDDLTIEWAQEFEKSIFHRSWITQEPQTKFYIYTIMAAFLGNDIWAASQYKIGCFTPYGVYGHGILEAIYGTVHVSDIPTQIENIESKVAKQGFMYDTDETFPARVTQEDGIFNVRIIIPDVDLVLPDILANEYGYLTNSTTLYREDPQPMFDKLYRASSVNPAS